MFNHYVRTESQSKGNNFEASIKHSLYRRQQSCCYHNSSESENTVFHRLGFFISTLMIVKGVSQLLKQSDWAQIQDFK